MIGGVNYERITPEGLFVTYGEDRRDGQMIECDTVVLCAGQVPLRELQAPLEAAGGARAPDRRRAEAAESTPSGPSTRAPVSRPSSERAAGRGAASWAEFGRFSTV